MIGLVGLWGHLLAAALYAALAVWQLRHWQSEQRNRPLVTAFAVISVWTIFVALLGERQFLAQLAESGRNLAFLAFMYGLLRGADDDRRQRALKWVYAAVAGVVGLQIVIGGVMPEFEKSPRIFEALASTGHMIGLTIAAGSLVLVHNLYAQAAPDSRWGIRLPMLALAAMWAYELHLHTVAYLTRSPVDELYAMRGAVMAMLVPLFAVASRRNSDWKVQISRAATFQSLSVLAILAYLIVMMSTTRAMESVGGDWVRVGQIALLLAMTLAALVLLPSGRARAWMRVVVAKHLFEHRYDYRSEWLRFTQTVARHGEDGASLEQRVIKGLADIADSPAGLLLLIEDGERFAPAAEWNCPPAAARREDDDGRFARFLEASAHVVDFTALRSGFLVAGNEKVPVPAWIAEIEQAWAGVPLVHGGRLVGLVVLRHPPLRRPLDWEDFDLFRTAGIQAASYLAEARSQEALANAQRFDEFNRRFAFIMHDIKNLVSQLALVARNAERHADNPEFRADMIATLQASVRKMNELLARLSQGKRSESASPRPVALGPVAASAARGARPDARVEVEGDDLVALADPVGLEQALSHLLHNAIDASAGGDPVRVRIGSTGAEASIEVIDRGAGMSSEFIRTRLFQPFASTKETGFGVGAFEARSLVAAMGGRIEVESREGEGSRFTVFLPLAEQGAWRGEERMCA